MMELKGKKVLVVGLGKSGLAAALFLRRRGAQVTVSDVRSRRCAGQGNPRAARRGHHGRGRRPRPAHLSPPGPDRRQPRRAARHSRTGAGASNFGLPVIGELELAARFLKGKTLAITGSNGKTTTTTLLGEILEAAGLPTLVGGNIGVPVVALIDQSTDDTWSVLEVSSFQLESTEQFHPAIAVILNITPDHLDRHGSFENYALAKERIFAAQTAEDFARPQRRQHARRVEAAPRSEAPGFTGSRSSIRSTREPGSSRVPSSIALRQNAAGRKRHAADRHPAQRRAQR